MYAQRYGTIPVVHATGGLKDSVVQYDPFADGNATNSTGNETKVEDVPGKGTGWQFDAADAGGSLPPRPFPPFPCRLPLMFLLAPSECSRECDGGMRLAEKMEDVESFVVEHGGAGLKFGLWNALHTYKNYKDSWKRIMQRCMLTDFSWEKRSALFISFLPTTRLAHFDLVWQCEELRAGVRVGSHGSSLHQPVALLSQSFPILTSLTL